MCQRGSHRFLDRRHDDRHTGWRPGAPELSRPSFPDVRHPPCRCRRFSRLDPAGRGGQLAARIQPPADLP
ncbi:hypothetical protein [Azospirillum endophyticum]